MHHFNITAIMIFFVIVVIVIVLRRYFLCHRHCHQRDRHQCLQQQLDLNPLEY